MGAVAGALKDQRGLDRQRGAPRQRGLGRQRPRTLPGSGEVGGSRGVWKTSPEGWI